LPLKFVENESGSNNTFIGNVAGEHNISGSNNTVIGSGADVDVLRVFMIFLPSFLLQ
jgi:hypothetical protein